MASCPALDTASTWKRCWTRRADTLRRSSETLVGEATGLTLLEAGAGATVHLRKGMPIHADRVVLALGNYASPRPTDDSFRASDRCLHDPWAPGALSRVLSGERVLLLGTGLTMMDIALDLHRRGIRSVTAISRRGLLPHAHRTRRGGIPPAASELPGFAAPSVRAWLRAIRRHARRIVAAGGDWRDVIAALRPHLSSLWQSLPFEERRRFLRHVRPYWDIHRHRAAPATAETVKRLIREGWLSVQAGRVQSYRPRGTSVEAIFRPRGADTPPESVLVDKVIDCTGPDGDVRRLPDPLLQSLLASGLIRPDPLRLGIEADGQGAILDASGVPSQVLFLAGTLLKPRDWECTAVPELREHARRLALHLAASCPRRRTEPEPALRA